MKLSERSQVEALAKFDAKRLWTTSFFLDTDKSRLMKKEIMLNLKNLLSRAAAGLENLDISAKIKDSLSEDLTAIETFCRTGLNTLGAPGLALFSCSGRGFFRNFELPHGPRPRILFERSFYVRPLSAIFDRHRKSLICLLDSRKAVWYESTMNVLNKLAELESKEPPPSKGRAFKGYETKKIERHIEAHVLAHLKQAAGKTFQIEKKNGYDSLFIGCDDKLFSNLDGLLHNYLKQKLSARMKARPGTTADKVLQEAADLEKRLKKAEEDDIVLRLVGILEKGGRGCSGLLETLRKLNVYEVQTLVVTHGFSAEGRICPSCRFLYVDELRCPSCEVKTDKTADIVDEAIEQAMTRDLPVKHITPPSKLDRYGKIGAFLKYTV